MKTIGIVGGMAWPSSLEYYRLLNQGANARLGGTHSARVIMDSMDFQEIEDLQREDDWGAIAEVLAGSARRLEGAGAELILVACNTVHKVAPAIQEVVRIPLIHIADAAAVEIKAKGVRTIGLLGSRFTMEEDFYREKLLSHGIATLIPGTSDRDIIHRVVYEELSSGKIVEESRRKFVRIIGDLADAGAEGVLLGCTEIPLLVRQQDVPIPVFDSAKLHVGAALDLAIPR